MARKKKTPIVRNIINDTPNTYRAINRMNGIVTMIEYTGEDDIKAYELEPTYQEIGGGGELNNPILTISVDASAAFGDIGVIPLLVNTDGTLQSKTVNITGGTSVFHEDIFVLGYDMGGGDSAFVWDGATAYPSILGTVETLTISDEVNCSVTLDQGEGKFYAMITDPAQPASFTLTIS